VEARRCIAPFGMTAPTWIHVRDDMNGGRNGNFAVIAVNVNNHIDTFLGTAFPQLQQLLC